MVYYCSIASCHNTQYKDVNNPKMVFYSLPALLPLNKGKGNRARYGKLKAEIQNKQRAAWIDAIKRGYQEGYCPDFNDKKTLKFAFDIFTQIQLRCATQISMF